MGGGDEGDVVVPTAPGAALQVVQPQAVLELALVVLDQPAHLCPPHQIGDLCGRGQVRDPVARRRVLTVRPLDQEGPGRQDAVPPVAAAALLLGCGQWRSLSGRMAKLFGGRCGPNGKYLGDARFHEPWLVDGVGPSRTFCRHAGQAWWPRCP